MSLQILLRMQTAVSPGQRRPGLRRHERPRRHHHGAAIPPAPGAPGGAEDAVPGRAEEQRGGHTGNTGSFSLGAVCRFTSSFLPLLSMDFRFCYPPCLMGSWISKTFWVCHKYSHFFLFFSNLRGLDSISSSIVSIKYWLKKWYN